MCAAQHRCASRPEDVAKGYVLACQAVVESNVAITVPPQEKIERRTDHRPHGGRGACAAWLRSGQEPDHPAGAPEPTAADDGRSDRRLEPFAQVAEPASASQRIQHLACPCCAGSAAFCAQEDWQVTAILESPPWDCCPDCPARLIDLKPGHVDDEQPLWGAAIDIGTTTVSLWLVNLLTGEVKAQVAEYNRQITRGEDVISRIIYAGKNGQDEEMRGLMVDTINELVEQRVQAHANRARRHRQGDGVGKLAP